MKRLLYLSLLLTSCQQKKSNQAGQNTELTFNSFRIGTPADSILYILGFAPTHTKANKLEYDDVTFEGVRGNVDYDLAGGRFVGGNFIELQGKGDSFDTIQNRLTRQFGKPSDQNKSTMVWEGDNASIYFAKSESGSYVNFSRKTKPGLAFKPLSQP